MKPFNFKNKKNSLAGFTLLELLVVIAIIGILASVVMVSLGNSKSKANKSALIQELKEMSKVMELEKMDSGNYSKLLPMQWLGLISGSSVFACNSFYGPSNTSNYKANALAICEKISSLVDNNNAGYFGIVVWDPSKQDGSYYSIMAVFGGQSYCIGSSGQSFPSVNSSSLGCFNNP